MPTILHVSDLHRAPDDPISNDELVSSLLRDLDRATREDPSVPMPDAIVASGDIIQGVPLETPNYRLELDRQYSVALAFLDELARRLVGGDRSRVVITNGNHDVDWNTAFAAMTRVEPADEPPNVSDQLRRVDTPYRWCWRTRQIYRVADLDLYERRLEAFWDFHSRFYDGVPNLFRIYRGAEVNLFELFDRRVAVACFNSCHNNDCFALHGAIAPPAISRACLDLDDSGPYDLRIAVWHHGLDGPPYQIDYMDSELVRSMIGRGFRLGLHGHQHHSNVTPYSIQLPSLETMAVVSAGSLCAGRRDLPTGVHRQYNILEIRPDFLSARVHVREMTVGTNFGPSRRIIFGGQSYIDVRWTAPVNAVGQEIDLTAQRTAIVLQNAERALMAGDIPAAFSLLDTVRDRLPEHGRRLMTEAAVRLENWELVASLTIDPKSIDELVVHVRANSELRRWGPARAALLKYSDPVGLPEAQRRELEARLAAEEAISS